MEFTFGIEEEFFVVDEHTQLIEPQARAHFLARAQALAGPGIGHELLQSQVELATPICRSMAEARHHLGRMRGALVKSGTEVGLSVIAAGTHPTAEWSDQMQTPKRRYDRVVAELQMLAMRNLVCGMHVHVGLDGDDRRIDVMGRSIPFLPLLLALSCSSPFWRGMPTGFASYRMTAYDELPRTGLPPLLADWAAYKGYTDVLTRAGIIRDPSFVWWAIRPSHAFPTLELRIPDACTRIEDALCVAALYGCLVRALVLDPAMGAGCGPAERAIAKENKWLVQRFGLGAELADPFAVRESSDVPTAVRQLVAVLRPHAEALDCLPEIERAEDILRTGNSADQQIAIYEAALAEGSTAPEALARVKAWLQAQTQAGTHADP